MAKRRYLNFDLHIEPSGQGFRTWALSFQGSRAEAEFTPPFTHEELREFFIHIGQPRADIQRDARRPGQPSKIEVVKDFGGRLFQAVFRDEVRSCLRTSWHDALQAKQGLRLRLHLVKVPELADLPWEYLYDTTDNTFLVLSTKTPLVRYLDLPKPMQPLAVKPPLRVLVMISSPRGPQALDVKREWQVLRDRLAELERRQLVVLDLLEEASWEALLDKLQRGTAFHIFHFIGHGDFDEQAGRGVLLLEGSRGRPHPVTGEDLMTLLDDHDSLRLAILNACEGARLSHRTLFAGTAQSLVQKGIPAVIAMQFNITDRAAITFSRWFYQSIARGFTVDAALAVARQAMARPGDVEDVNVEWGTPVLYMHAPDGRIFEVEKPGANEQSLDVRAFRKLGEDSARTGTHTSHVAYGSARSFQPQPVENLYPSPREQMSEPFVQIRMELLTNLQQYQRQLDAYVRGFIASEEQVDRCVDIRSRLERVNEAVDELTNPGNWRDTRDSLEAQPRMANALVSLTEAQGGVFHERIAAFDNALDELKRLVREAMRATMRPKDLIQIDEISEIASNAYDVADDMRQMASDIGEQCKENARDVLRELQTLIGRIDEQIRASRGEGAQKVARRDRETHEWRYEPQIERKRSEQRYGL